MTVLGGAGSVDVATPGGEAGAYLNAAPAGGVVGVNNAAGLQVAALGVHDGDGVIQALGRTGARLFLVPVWKLPPGPEESAAEDATAQEGRAVDTEVPQGI